MATPRCFAQIVKVFCSESAGSDILAISQLHGSYQAIFGLRPSPLRHRIPIDVPTVDRRHLLIKGSGEVR